MGKSPRKGLFLENGCGIDPILLWIEKRGTFPMVPIDR